MKVLIVEDDEAIANLVKFNLTVEGFQCICAFDGKTGADYIENGSFDLILLDIMLPEIDGYELLEYVKPYKVLPILFHKSFPCIMRHFYSVSILPKGQTPSLSNQLFFLPF